MFPHHRVSKGGNDVQDQPPYAALEQKFITALTTVGDGAITAAALAGGIIRRTGPTAGYADTFPTADSIINALDNPTPGDSFPLIIINGVAFANTIAAAPEGVTLGTNVNIAASLVREYLVTVLNATTRSTAVASTTNASAVISNLTAAQVRAITTGMSASGTGLAASATVISTNETALTVTLSGNSTATADNILVTFAPRVSIAGVRSSTA